MFTMVSSSKSMCIPSFSFIGCYVSELHDPYCIVWHEVLCFTRITMFTELFVLSALLAFVTSPSFVALHIPVSEIPYWLYQFVAY